MPLRACAAAPSGARALGSRHGPVRIGLKLSQQDTDIAELRAIWQVADESGFDHLWNFDHFAAIMGDPERRRVRGLDAARRDGRGHEPGAHRLHGHGQHLPAPGRARQDGSHVDHLSRRTPRARHRRRLGRDRARDARHRVRHGGPARRVAGRGLPGHEAALHARSARRSRATRYTLRDAIANPKPVQRPLSAVLDRRPRRAARRCA